MDTHKNLIGKRLSEVMGNEKPLFFIKTFDKPEYREKFINGDVYCNTFDYFIKAEKKYGKGMGDQFETINVVSNAELEAKNPETGKIIFLGKVENYGIKMKRNEVENMHVFCATGIFPEWFEIEKINDENKLVCKLRIPDEYKKEMEKNFGEVLVLFAAQDFIDLLGKYADENNQYVEYGRVKYLDYSSNPKERLEAFIDNKTEFYFQKDIAFENQFEFRFVFPEIKSKEAETINIGEIKSYYPTIENFKGLIEAELGLLVNLK